MARALAGLAAAAVLAGCGSGAGPSQRPAPRPTVATVGPAARPTILPPPPRPHETLAVALHRRTALRAAPGSRRVLARLGARTAFGSPTVLSVVRRHGQWLGVLAPELGNGGVGWLRSTAAGLLREQWAITVDLSAHRATLRKLGRRVLSFPVAVGAPEHPTPPGRYGVTDRLRTDAAGSPYGCCVLALSGHQPNVPQGWSGGDRLAIHGTSDPASIGAAVSHGCLRASAQALQFLMRRVPLGTPVVVRA